MTQNSNYPSSFSQPDYRQVVQHEPNAYQSHSQAVADGWMQSSQAISVNCSNGLQCLSTLNQLYIKQHVEMLEAIGHCETNNKYTIKNSAGQTLFNAEEDNDCCTRCCCGSTRPFEMKILDNYENEVIHLSRPLACQSCCFPCCMQRIEVFSPSSYLIGSVEAVWSILKPIFTIRNALNEEEFEIKGPICQFNICSDIKFKILSKETKTEVGCISKQWSTTLKEVLTDADFFEITFPAGIDVHMKACIIGACFLIDYMYFENNN